MPSNPTLERSAGSQSVMKNNQPIIEILTAFGAKKGGATPAQIALAW